MRNDHFGYEAPPTHMENIGDPILNIGEEEDIHLTEIHHLLPLQVTLFVKPKPVYCHQSILITHPKCQPFSLYQNEQAVHSIDLFSQRKGFYMLENQVFELSEQMPFRIDWGEQNHLYQKNFLVIHDSFECSEEEAIYPLGGTYHIDPAQCTQTFFNSICNKDPIFLYIYPKNEAQYHWMQKKGSLESFQSLGDDIKMQKITLFLTYENIRFEYKSYRYCLYHADSFSIDFIKHF